VADTDDERLSGDTRDRDFLRRPRSPFSRCTVDVSGRDTFWDQQSRQGSRAGLCSGVDDLRATVKTRDGLQSPVAAQQRPDKPRIWSLADVATSTTSSSGGPRRSPSQSVDAAVRPAPLTIATPSLSLPPIPAGFQPWSNGLSGHHRHAILPPASTSSPPATHRPLPPVANGLLRYAPYPVVVAGSHPTSHAAVSHQFAAAAAAAAAHAAAVNAAVQARLQPPFNGPVDVSTPSAAVGRCALQTPPHWPSTAVKSAASLVICTGRVLSTYTVYIVMFRRYT